ncbi:MAG: hypothetical protein ACFE8B_14880 [Candidatus Hermodarchaeota archaeon]
MNEDKNEKSKDLATARRKIKSIMKKEGTDEITIERQYLPELFSVDLLEISVKTGENVEKMFSTITKLILEKADNSIYND